MRDVIRLATVNIDCPDPTSLSEFYRKLLDWELVWGNDTGEFIIIGDPDGGVQLSFQLEPSYTRPVWPDEKGKPGKSMHLDFQVTDLTKAQALALSLGAVRASEQFLEAEGCIVFFDPAGHPFCLFVD